jgi:hypothetical protein
VGQDENHIQLQWYTQTPTQKLVYSTTFSLTADIKLSEPPRSKNFGQHSILFHVGKYCISITYPISVMPDINSSLVNSHCVAALNFHAMMRTSFDSGLKLRSSRNLIIPSAVILSGSAGSKGV